MKLLKYCFILCLCLQTTACVSHNHNIKLADHPKAGFSNVNDIPFPESALIDQQKTMIVGGQDHWAGHLVYTSKKNAADIIDFINVQMPSAGWEKISALRGPETNFTFTKNNRVANVKIITTKDFLSEKTMVIVDMAPKIHNSLNCDSCQK